jgi:hypothetical protein
MPSSGDRVPAVRITPDVTSGWRAACRDCGWAFTPKRNALLPGPKTQHESRQHVAARAHRVRITHLSECEYRPVAT